MYSAFSFLERLSPRSFGRRTKKTRNRRHAKVVRTYTVAYRSCRHRHHLHADHQKATSPSRPASHFFQRALRVQVDVTAKILRNVSSSNFPDSRMKPTSPSFSRFFSRLGLPFGSSTSSYRAHSGAYAPSGVLPIRSIDAPQVIKRTRQHVRYATCASDGTQFRPGLVCCDFMNLKFYCKIVLVARLRHIFSRNMYH